MSPAAAEYDPLATALLEHFGCSGGIEVERVPDGLIVRCSGCGGSTVAPLTGPARPAVAPPPAAVSAGAGAARAEPEPAVASVAPPSEPESPALPPEVATARERTGRAIATPTDRDRSVAPVGAPPPPRSWGRRLAPLVLLLTVLVALVVAFALQRSAEDSAAPLTGSGGPSTPEQQPAGSGAGGSPTSQGESPRDSGPESRDQSRGGRSGSGGNDGNDGSGSSGSSGRSSPGEGSQPIRVGDLEETLVRGLFPIGLASGWRENGTTSEGGVLYVPESASDASVIVFAERDADLGPRALAQRTADFLRDAGVERVGRPEVAGGVGRIRGGSSGLRVFARTSIDGGTAIIGVATIGGDNERRGIEAEAIVESLPG